MSTGDFDNYEDVEEYLTYHGWINFDVLRFEWPYYEEEDPYDQEV